MRIDRYIILGGGVASGYAAQEMAKNELAPGELGIISSDDTLPYNRPPLSKAYLAGKKNRQDILINSPEFYEQHGIDVVLNTVVGWVDLDENRLFTSSGDEIQSCTGSEADCAGWRRVFGMEVSAVLVDQVIHRGDINSGSFSVWWLVEQRLVGAFVMNRPDEERELAPEWIRFARRPLPQVLMGDMMSLSDMERQLL